MADQNPLPVESDDESKKDTVRINLPPGLVGRPTGAPAGSGPATVKLKPASASPEEAKKETAVMGRPAEAPKPKSDTSRVQVSAARPVQPETPRPTVKLKQPDAAPVAGPAPAAMPTPLPGGVAVAEPTGAQAGLALAAMVLAVAVAVYLAMLAFG